MTNTPQHFQGHQKQGKSEKLPRSEEPRDMTTECNTVYGMGSSNNNNNKKTLGKN